MKQFPYGILLIVLIVLAFVVFASQALMNYFSTDGFVVANVIRVVDDNIIVGNNCTAIIAQTSTERAQSIELGLENRIENRPNTHDTLATILKSFNITLDSVEITRYDSQYYYSNINLRSGDKILKLDAMPSDAIALALRLNSTIYINKTLLNQVGSNICAAQ